MTDPLDASTFKRRFAELMRAGSGAGSDHNQHCIQCVRSRGCSRCTFCQDCDGLLRCHYCISCARCTDCSHCRRSTGLIACQHCSDCEHCLSSSYLGYSVGLTDCTYCFGCVGLSRRDFHILNEPYERDQYFTLIERLTPELLSRSAQVRG